MPRISVFANSSVISNTCKQFECCFRIRIPPRQSLPRISFKKKKGRISNDILPRKKNPGSALLSHGRFPQYPRHWSPSLLCSVWEQVLLLRHGHQEKSIQKKSICPFQLETEPDSWLRSERFDTTKPLGRLVRVGCRHHCLCASRLSRS